MGLSFSCPFSNDSDIECGLQSIIVRSVSFGDKEIKTLERSISFKYDSPIDTTMIMKKSFDSGDMILESSVSFKQREMDHTLVSISTELDPQSPKHEAAAVKLQKVYKSFRTRRKLADCAVLVEQRWWKLLDFAELKHSSVSFFDIEQHETAISRWSRAKTRAAKVGKGLLKNGKAQKLARQHWLEAIDPRHRYGHNLHFYFDKWLESQSREPFFYWLDIGEGKELNLEKLCSRCILQEQCIKYLGPMERRNYEVSFEDGKFFYKESREVLDTSVEPRSKWIFVLSTSKILYIGKKKKGTFQHSSFLAGGATSAAGRLVVENGTLKAVWPHSGHYRPTPENFQDFIAFLTENNVDLTDVKMDPADDEEQSLGKQQSSLHVRNNSEEEVEVVQEDFNNITETQNVEDTSNIDPSNFNTKPSHLKIPSNDLLAEMQSESTNHVEHDDGYNYEKHEETIPKETILKRINSHKEAKSYQLGKQLSCKWTTGAGPRIGCVRDYPSELQFRALEQVNLSPRSANRVSEIRSPKASTPNRSLLSVNAAQYKLQSSPLCLGTKHTL